MTAALHRLDEKVAALEAAALDIVAKTREAHETIQALQEIRRDIRTMLDTEVHDLVMDLISAEVKAGLESFAADIAKAQRAVEAKVEHEAKRLMAMWIGDPNAEGTPELLDLALARRKADQIAKGIR